VVGAREALDRRADRAAARRELRGVGTARRIERFLGLAGGRDRPLDGAGRVRLVGEEIRVPAAREELVEELRRERILRVEHPGPALHERVVQLEAARALAEDRVERRDEARLARGHGALEQPGRDRRAPRAERVRGGGVLAREVGDLAQERAPAGRGVRRARLGAVVEAPQELLERRLVLLARDVHRGQLLVQPRVVLVAGERELRLGERVVADEQRARPLEERVRRVVADEPPELGAVGLHEHDRREALDVEARRQLALLLRVDLQRHRALLEEGSHLLVAPRGLVEPLAGAAPGREDVDQDDFPLLLRGRQRGIPGERTERRLGGGGQGERGEGEEAHGGRAPQRSV
jgi:hypothetical protein